MSDKSDRYFRKSQLKERGWTETGIKKFLKHPDSYEPNPIHPNGAPMGFFLMSKVTKLERSD